MRRLAAYFLLLGASLSLVSMAPGRAAPASASATAPATAAATTRAAPPLVFRTMIELLDPMPRELRPDPKKGWDKYTYPKALAWISNRAMGQHVEMTVALSQVAVGADPLKLDKAKPWLTYVYLRGGQFQFAGTTNLWRLPNLQYRLDEQEAKLWESRKSGHLLKVKGIISGIEVNPPLGLDAKKAPSPPGHEYVLRLKEIELLENR